jgi:hypothetical protein
MVRRIGLAGVLWFSLCASGTDAFRLQIEIREDVAEISSTELSQNAVHVEKSNDLSEWHDLGLFEGRVLGYKDKIEKGMFYRATATALDRFTPLQYANQVRAFGTSLHSRAFNLDYEPSYLKFVIDLREPGKVYFHADYLHYNFVSINLPGFIGISPQEFEKAALTQMGQRLLVGTVFFSPRAGPQNEVGIQFEGNEPYSAEFVLKFLRTVKDRMISEKQLKFFYIPEYGQVKAAEESAAFLLLNGFETSSLARWTIQDVSYSSGWAVGKLKYFAATEIQNAYLRGELKPEDILATDFTPAEIPRVAGIITLNPSSPGSHVAILARADGTPYVYLASEDLKLQLQQLLGKEILFRADVPSSFRGQALGARGSDYIKLLDITGQALLVAGALERAKPLEPLKYRKKERAPFFSAATKDIYPEHFAYFGGKATHFGLLSRTIPTHSPDAIAISFNLWDDFMLQEISPGQTLRSAIEARIEHGVQAQDPAVLSQELSAIREMIKDAPFTLTQRSEVLTAIERFGTDRNIRFRSSSNVEDSETFIAAGLYDSYSGCVADDLDSDESGPSVCNPTEPNEHGVFRAIRKVYASFYNEGAFNERRRRLVREDEVGMALLVHHSFPDEIERANGVVLLS